MKSELYREIDRVARALLRASMRVKQKLAVPFSAKNGRLNYIRMVESERQHRMPHLFDSRVLRGFVADDSAFTYALAPNFELRLYQHDQLASSPLRLRSRECRCYNRRKYEGRGDKRHVYRDQVDGLIYLVSR
jgi:hypothetical protein